MRQSAVVLCKKRMKRRVAPVTKYPQGSLDKKSNWAQAHYGWVMQLLLRFDINVCLDLFLKESTGLAVPLWFDETHLRPINKFGIGWWDEIHKKCEIGGYLGEQVLNARNDDGEYDSQSDCSTQPYACVDQEGQSRTRLNVLHADAAPRHRPSGDQLA